MTERQISKPVIDSDQLSLLHLDGYKSIEECHLELTMLNVLIGANGAGKSNFIGFFKLIRKILDEQLQLTVSEQGGPDALLHYGRKTTEQISVELRFGISCYKFELKPTSDNRMMFQREVIFLDSYGKEVSTFGHFETSNQFYKSNDAGINHLDKVIEGIKKLNIYHFHDTSASAKVKQIHGINDNLYLKEDASNLAAFLYRLKQEYESHYKRIVKTIQLVAPFFGDFILRPTIGNAEKIQLEWVEKNQDTPFTASALSDGTLRFICLATVLMQPDELCPPTILIDEPELGLHPYAITVLGSLMRSAAERHQLIISTQSVELLNQFEVEDVIVVDKKEGASTFKRLNPDELSSWLEDYSLGELWTKNLLGGRPSR
ncbi:AAA family ATPase [Thiomicrospira microaerophila]|uniref:AAA family ATPase n=1 Tax=Thiomicrospira microaerophila TaxID=406020 RepID=UPI000AEFC875|nr:AAA family ATPase [Thiomicrospira microaerophila]